MTPTELAAQAVSEWDARYERVPQQDVVLIGPDNTSFDVADGLRRVITNRHQGAYRLACVSNPDWDNNDIQAWQEFYAEVQRHNVYWVIPPEDELYDDENMGIVFTGA